MQSSAIETLDLPALRTVAGQVTVIDNPALRSVRLPALTAASFLSVTGCPAIESAIAPSLATTGGVHLDGPIHTLDLSALTSADTVELDNATLDNLAGLRSLESARWLRLARVTGLKDFTDLQKLRHVSILWLEFNSDLTSLDGLEPLTEVPGELIIRGNGALASIAALRNVTHVGAFLDLEDNMISDIALPGLLSIDGALSILREGQLTSLHGLDTLRSVGGEIMILDNDQLSDDEIRAFRARF